MADVKKITRLLISKGPASFIASVDPDGYPTMKAMLPPRKVVGIKTFYFITTAASLRVAHFRDNPKSSVYFCDGQHYVGLMLRGTMEVLEDPTIKETLWLETDTAYYKGGVSDPDYCVLKFTAETGRLYQNFRSIDFSV
ncbi:pyridoxamine 5'-phosphate oxidase family protein [Desulfovibrio sp. OttesenSCG-928-C14]|nr:pyridoxamine 5'-phosphate oxidase family protein [Desulfovibrio sp. OttesenSCG-928-C14]